MQCCTTVFLTPTVPLRLKYWGINLMEFVQYNVHNIVNELKSLRCCRKQDTSEAKVKIWIVSSSLSTLSINWKLA